MTEPNSRRGAGGLIAVGLGVLVVGVIAAILIAHGSDHRDSKAVVLRPTTDVVHQVPAVGRDAAEVTIPGHGPEVRIQRSFFGLSTEYWTLPTDEHHTALYKRVVTMLHVPGDDRYILRIGGDSSDHAVFDPTARRLPPWAFAVTPQFVERTAAIVRQLNLRVIIDLNTFTVDPRAAAAWARAAQARFPAGSLLGFEVGNEPDLYDHALWVSQLKNTGFDVAKLPLAITAKSNVQDYSRFADALRLATPHVALLAPALALPETKLNWIATLLRSPHPGLKVITAHRYPYSACAAPGTPARPTIHKLLSERAVLEPARTIEPAVRLAHRFGIPVRLSEINSVTCGGVPRISNSFATALWIPDILFELVRAGVDGVNLHARVYSINAPFTFTHLGLRSRPLFYGMILFARMLGPHSRLVPAQVHAAASLHLKVWAVREGARTLNVLLINKGDREARIKLHLPTAGPAMLQRLIAPSAAATRHVTLAGQRLDDQVRWRGRARVEKLSGNGGTFTVTVRRQSATMMTVNAGGS
jgi:hypothetical protein